MKNTDPRNNNVVAKVAEQQSNNDGIHTLTSGIRVKTKPCPSYLLQEAIASLVEPQVPVVMIESKGREEPNPNDPAYLAAMQQFNVDRAQAIVDTIITFSVKLVDGLPADEEWLEQLELLDMRRKGALLDGFDVSKKSHKEYLFKKFVACAEQEDSMFLLSIIGINTNEVEKAMDSFRSDAEQSTDNGDSSEE